MSMTRLTGPRLDAVLAGLRLLQYVLINNKQRLLAEVECVYTNGGTHDGLAPEHIDELCQVLNHAAGRVAAQNRS